MMRAAEICLSLVVVILLGAVAANSAELRRTHRIGNVGEPKYGDSGLVADCVSWLDEKTLVYGKSGGAVCCRNIRSDADLWSSGKIFDLEDFSVCRKQRRLAVLCRKTEEPYSEKLIRVFDCTTGTEIFSADTKQLAELLGLRFVIPTKIALTPEDGRLIVCEFDMAFGQNAYVLDSTFTKVEARFSIDARLRELTISPEGRRVATLAYEDVVCIREIADDEEIYFVGKRIFKEPNGLSFTIGPPFSSHVRHDGEDRLILSIDGGCFGMGRIAVIDLKSKTESFFDARNGHIEMDVSFAKERIVLTGTSTDLTLLNFNGEVLAQLRNATTQRNLWVEFSPSATQIAVGSSDGMLSIFAVDE